MNFGNLQQLKYISNNLNNTEKKIKEYIKRQDILDFIEKKKKRQYSDFNINTSSYSFSQFPTGNMLHVKIYDADRSVIINSNSMTLKEEYKIKFIGNKIIIKYIINDKRKLSYTEKTYEYENDILIRENERTMDKTDDNVLIENEVIYDYRLKMLLKKFKCFVKKEMGKQEKIEYEATSFIEGINYDTKKNSNSNYSYLNLHLPFVEITKEIYEKTQKRLFHTEEEKQKSLNKNKIY